MTAPVRAAPSGLAALAKLAGEYFFYPLFSPPAEVGIPVSETTFSRGPPRASLGWRDPGVPLRPGRG